MSICHFSSNICADNVTFGQVFIRKKQCCRHTGDFVSVTNLQFYGTDSVNTGGESWQQDKPCGQLRIVHGMTTELFVTETVAEQDSPAAGCATINFFGLRSNRRRVGVQISYFSMCLGRRGGFAYKILHGFGLENTFAIRSTLLEEHRKKGRKKEKHA